MVEPDEMANVFAFVASPEARYMTGSIVAMDGGLTA
jgi:NAD(P)-dependent dehydrogenase (short-subunit alcohol dehydrogenase family)